VIAEAGLELLTVAEGDDHVVDLQRGAAHGQLQLPESAVAPPDLDPVTIELEIGLALAQ
jgi:hypothetical protein